LSHGLAIFFLDQQPIFPDEFHDEFGYRTDYKGLGVFLYRSESRQKWVSIFFNFTDYFPIVRPDDTKQGASKHNQIKKLGPAHHQQELLRIRPEQK
jgi:hypothetical protein